MEANWALSVGNGCEARGQQKSCRASSVFLHPPSIFRKSSGNQELDLCKAYGRPVRPRRARCQARAPPTRSHCRTGCSSWPSLGLRAAAGSARQLITPKEPFFLTSVQCTLHPQLHPEQHKPTGNQQARQHLTVVALNMRPAPSQHGQNSSDVSETTACANAAGLGLTLLFWRLCRWKRQDLQVE